jgi:hypothetical protein
MARMVEVEVKRWHGSAENRIYGWQLITIEEAFRLGDDTFRCPECFGKVKRTSASENPPIAAHGEHFQRNKGCSLGDCFDGEKRKHSSPLN